MRQTYKNSDLNIYDDDTIMIEYRYGYIGRTEEKVNT